uniref:Haem-binding uptake Tiki superfamily ChaN domain-containing protein n=1 Tax=Fagus sylvatica TaxID=28930 RepID=A0A2N9H2U3_FAGSY
MGSTSGYDITHLITVVLERPTSYHSWSHNMIVFLKGRKLWRYVIGAIPKPVPKPPITNSSDSDDDSPSDIVIPVDDFEEQLTVVDPPLKYAEDIELFAKYKDRRRFTQFMMGLCEDFEPTQVALLSHSPLPSLDAAVKELISEGNRRPQHHLPFSDAFLATPPGACALQSVVARAKENPTEIKSPKKSKSPMERVEVVEEEKDVIVSRIYDATVIGEPMVVGKDKLKVWEKLTNARIVYLGEAERVPIRDNKELELEIVKNLRKRCVESDRPISLALEAFPYDLQEQLNQYMDFKFC